MRFKFLISVVTIHILILVSLNGFAQQKPNVLFIMTDELSAETMSINLGTKFINTPNIDYLASHGVRLPMLIVQILYVCLRVVPYSQEGIRMN